MPQTSNLSWIYVSTFIFFMFLFTSLLNFYFFFFLLKKMHLSRLKKFKFFFLI